MVVRTVGVYCTVDTATSSHRSKGHPKNEEFGIRYVRVKRVFPPTVKILDIGNRSKYGQTVDKYDHVVRRRCSTATKINYTFLATIILLC